MWTESERKFQEDMQNNAPLKQDCLAEYFGGRADIGICHYFVSSPADSEAFVKCMTQVEVFCHDCQCMYIYF